MIRSQTHEVVAIKSTSYATILAPQLCIFFNILNEMELVMQANSGHQMQIQLEEIGHWQVLEIIYNTVKLGLILK